MPYSTIGERLRAAAARLRRGANEEPYVTAARVASAFDRLAATAAETAGLFLDVEPVTHTQCGGVAFWFRHPVQCGQMLTAASITYRGARPEPRPNDRVVCGECGRPTGSPRLLQDHANRTQYWAVDSWPEEVRLEGTWDVTAHGDSAQSWAGGWDAVGHLESLVVDRARVQRRRRSASSLQARRPSHPDDSADAFPDTEVAGQEVD